MIRAGMRHLDTNWTPERYLSIDAAIEDNTERLAELHKRGGFAPVERALKLDRALALAARGRDDEAAELLRELARGDALPPYASQLAGDIAMRQHRPLDAAAHYRDALVPQPEDVTLHVSLAYAYLEAGSYGELDRTLAELDRIDGASLDTRLLRIRMARYSDRLREARQRLDALPADERLTAAAELEAGALAHARGLPRAAAAAYERVQAESPDNIHAAIGLAEAAWAAGALDEADRRVAELNASAPEHPGVKRLTRSWMSARRARLSMEATAGFGYGSIDNKDDITTDVWLYSPLLANRFRVFAHHLRVAADFDDHRAQHIRAGAGVEATWRNWMMAVELGHEFTFGRDDTVSARVVWQPSDHWIFRAAADSRTDDVSVKGRYYYRGDRDAILSASRYAVGTTYVVDESRRFALDLGYYEFRDGKPFKTALQYKGDDRDDNERTTLTATWVERVHSAPRHAIDVHSVFYTSRNTREDAEYFNPKRDYALSATVVSDWLTRQEAGLRFNQRVAGTLGIYRQLAAYRQGRDQNGDRLYGDGDDDYGWKPFGELRYEHEWQYGDDMSARYGIGIRRFPYDGEYETRGYIYAAVNLRF